MSDAISREVALAELERHAKGATTIGGQTFRTIQLGEATEAIRAMLAVTPVVSEERPFVMGANHGYETAMEQVAEEARRYASHYPQASDGRNTFTLFAEWAEQAAFKPAALDQTPQPAPDVAGLVARAVELSEKYDTQKEVEQNPCGAWMAIQELAEALVAMEGK